MKFQLLFFKDLSAEKSLRSTFELIDELNNIDVLKLNDLQIQSESLTNKIPDNLTPYQVGYNKVLAADILSRNII